MANPIIEFPYSGIGEPNWPDAQNTFINPRSEGDKIVAEYTGSLTLTLYTGTRYVPRRGRTIISPPELVDMLTDAEYAVVPPRWRDMLLSQGGNDIDLDNPLTVKGLESFLMASRVDEIRRGIF